MRRLARRAPSGSTRRMSNLRVTLGVMLIVVVAALLLGLTPTGSADQRAGAAAPDVTSGRPQATPAASPIASPVATPGLASPVAGAVQTGCGNAASSSTEVAEAFVAAALRDDLDRARTCVTPGRPLRDWDDVFFASLQGAAAVAGCQRHPYTVYSSAVGPVTHVVIFDFGTPCLIAQLDDFQQRLYDAETVRVPVLLVQLDRNGERWYVRDALASVPD